MLKGDGNDNGKKVNTLWTKIYCQLFVLIFPPKTRVKIKKVKLGKHAQWKSVPSCKVSDQTDKNCKIIFPRPFLMFFFLEWMDEEMLFQKYLALVLGENGLYGKIQ